MYEYMQYPASVKGLASEIKRVCDDYYSRKIATEQVKSCVVTWAKNCPEKLFNANDINSTVKKIIGSKRVSLVNKLLEGYQINIFNVGVK